MAQQARPANVAALPLAAAPATPGRPPASAPLAVPAAAGGVPPGGPGASGAAATAAGAAAASRAAAAAAAPVPVPVPAPPPPQQQTVIGVDVRVPAGVLDDGAALFTRVPLQLHELTGVRPAPAPAPAPVPPRLPVSSGTPSAMSVVSMAPSAAHATARPPVLLHSPTPASVAAAAAAAVAAAAAAATARAGGPPAAASAGASSASTSTTTAGGLLGAGLPGSVRGVVHPSGVSGSVAGGVAVPPRLSLRDFQNSATSLAACGLPARLTEEALESVIDRAKGMSIGTGLPPEEGARHVTVWHKVEGRKIAGNAAPLRRNLYRYLERHPECEVYLEQDKLLDANGGVDPLTGESLTTFHEEHVPIWHTLEARKVTGNAAPLKKNLAAYLAKHKHCEVYDGQDKALKVAQQQAAAAAATAAGGAGGVGMGVGMGMVGLGSGGVASASTPSSTSAVSELPSGLGPPAGGGGVGAGVAGRGGIGTSGLGVDGLDGGGVEDDGVYGAGTVASPSSMLLSGGADGNGASRGGLGSVGVAGNGGGYPPGLHGIVADDEDDGGVVVAGTHPGLAAPHSSPFPRVQVVQVDAFGEPTHHVRLGSGGSGADADGVVSGGPAGVATGDKVGGGGGGGGIVGGGAGDNVMEPSLLTTPPAQSEEVALASAKHPTSSGFSSGVGSSALPGTGSSAVPIFVRTSGPPASATAAATAAATAGGDLTWYELSSSWSNMPAWRAAAATGAHAAAMGIGGGGEGGAAADSVAGSAGGGVSGVAGVSGVGSWGAPTPPNGSRGIPIPGRLGVGSSGTHQHGVGVGGGGLLGGPGGIMSGSGGDGGHLRDDLMLSGAGVGSFGGGAMSVTLGNTPGEVAMLLGGGHTPVACSIDLDHAAGAGDAGMDFSPSNFLSLYASPSERMLTLMQQRK